MHEWLRRTALAFGFMTRLPVPAVEPRAGDLAQASALFPLVGLVLATLGIAGRVLVEPLWGPAAGTVVAVFVVVLLTGGFHEDGLADCADGMWGGWEPEERLAIMRDSRLGTYGMLALVALFALRFALLVPLPLGVFAAAMISGHVLGRASVLVLARLAPALPGSSSAGVAQPLRRRDAAVAGILAVGPVLAVAGLVTVPLLVVTVAVTVAAARLFRDRLGGVTGDTFGATTVIVEVCAIATVVALQRVSG